VSYLTALDRDTFPAEQFQEPRQQYEAGLLGMWTFLATEVMFFGGMFLAYILFRWMYHGPFAEGSNELYMWFGFFNTGVLLCSSLSMALAVDYAKLGELKPLLRNLIVTMILGSTFLGVKAIEYTIDYNEKLIPGLNFDANHVEKLSKLSPPEQGNVELFFVLYFAMTGLHALHMVIGVVALGIMAYLIRKNKFADGTTVESLGLYWHFVDLVWVFLFPLLYLIDLNYKPH
jgi:cytochrome c oxidase subunit III